MDSSSSTKIPIRRVGLPGEAWLELQGTILIVHSLTWASSSSSFIPLEWVRASEGRKRDVRRLWAALMGGLVSVLLCLPLSLLLFYMPERHPLDVALAAGLAGLLCVAVAGTLYGAGAFLRRQRYTSLEVAGAPPVRTLSFWHAAGENAALDALVARIGRLETHIDETIPYPIRMKHMWKRPRPFRIALMNGAVVSLVLFLVVLSCSVLHRIGRMASFSDWYYAFLAAPPAFYVLMVALRRLMGLREPRAYRDAVRSCAQGALGEAREHLKGLLVQICAEQYAFDEAFYHCERLALEHPEIASKLQESLWGIKRMHARMQTSEA